MASHDGKPTLLSLARQLGVSRQTVSNVLNAPDVVHPTTRQRVLDAIDESGYRPSAAGRALRTRRSMNVAYRLYPAVDGINGAVMDRFLHNLVIQARQHGYRVTLFDSPDYSDEVEALVEQHRAGLIDALGRPRRAARLARHRRQCRLRGSRPSPARGRSSADRLSGLARGVRRGRRPLRGLAAGHGRPGRVRAARQQRGRRADRRVRCWAIARRGCHRGRLHERLPRPWRSVTLACRRSAHRCGDRLRRHARRRRPRHIERRPAGRTRRRRAGRPDAGRTARRPPRRASATTARRTGDPPDS